MFVLLQPFAVTQTNNKRQAAPAYSCSSRAIQPHVLDDGASPGDGDGVTVYLLPALTPAQLRNPANTVQTGGGQIIGKNDQNRTKRLFSFNSFPSRTLIADADGVMTMILPLILASGENYQDGEISRYTRRPLTSDETKITMPWQA